MPDLVEQRGNSSNSRRVGYNTASRLLSLDRPDDRTAIIRLDFTGDFGHEIGMLRIAFNSDGVIERMNADRK